MRGDLADRTVVVELPGIPEEKRVEKRTAARKYESARPRILAGLLDAVVLALKGRDSVKIEGLPRMADFAVVAVAAEPAMGVAPGTFLRAYGEARDAASAASVEGDLVAVAVQGFVQASGKWTGTAGELLTAIHRPDGARYWPASPEGMANALKRMAPSLQGLGIAAEQLPRVGKKRRWRLEQLSPPTVTTTVTNESVRTQGKESIGDGGDGRPPTFLEQPTREYLEKLAGQL